MKAIVNFIKRGRISHTRTFDIQNIGLFVKRLSSQFSEYELIVNEIDVTDVESTHYDKYEYGEWYSYTGRIVFCHSPYGERWWNEYINADDETELF